MLCSDPGVAQLVGRLVWVLVVSPLFCDAKSEEIREKRSICEYLGVCEITKISLTTYLTRTAKSSVFARLLQKTKYPGVAQLVGHLIWVQDAGSSNLPTRTRKNGCFRMKSAVFLTFYVFYCPPLVTWPHIIFLHYPLFTKYFSFINVGISFIWSFFPTHLCLLGWPEQFK